MNIKYFYVLFTTKMSTIIYIQKGFFRYMKLIFKRIPFLIFFFKLGKIPGQILSWDSNKEYFLKK